MEENKFPELTILSASAIEYLTNVRKLSTSSIKKFGLGMIRNDLIGIPCYDENGNLRLMKRRHESGLMIRKKIWEGSSYEVVECKSDVLPGGSPVLFGSNLCDPSLGYIVICFGDYDAIAVDSSGQQNAVSLPYGDKGLGWIDEQWDFLEQFEEIYIFPDFDSNRKVKETLDKKIEEISKRLGRHKIRIVKEELMFGCKDPNDLLIQKGKNYVYSAIQNAKHYEEDGVHLLADYPDIDLQEGTPIGYYDIDRATGGFGGSTLSIVSGDNHAGKTTFILNVIANLVAQEEPVFYWSGEQRVNDIRWWFEQILAGPHFLESRISGKTGREYYFPKKETIQKMRDWYRKFFIVYDVASVDEEKIFDVMEFSAKRHGCKKFFIDNLMAFTGGSGDYYNVQGDFTQSCKAFAKQWDVHSCLVAHNRKEMDPDTIPTKNDIEGSKKIQNWADFIIQCYRVPKNTKNKELVGISGVLSLCKNRNTGELINVKTMYESKSKRIVQASRSDDAYKVYSWENDLSQHQPQDLEEDYGI